MTRFTTSLLAATALIGFASVAQAADMGMPLRGPAVIPAAPESAAVSSGWYLRGDVGYIVENKSGFDEYETGYPKTITNDKLSAAPSIGIGIGYQFNEYLRGDVTGEFISTRSLKAGATYSGGDSTATPSTETANVKQYSGDVTSAVIMANLYADLGTYSGFTPYVGAGLGAAYNNMSNIYEYETWTAVGSGATSGSDGGIIPGDSKWNVAWALHAGFSYDLAPNLKLDAGYSFKDLGSVASNGTGTCFHTGCGAESIDLKKLYTHDIHVGARWMFDPVAQRVPVYSAPVVAKY